MEMWGCSMTPVFMLIAACQYVTHSKYINKNSRLPRVGGSKLGIGEHPGDDGKCEKTCTPLFPVPISGVPRLLPLFLLPQPPNYQPAKSVQHERGIWRTWKREKTKPVRTKKKQRLKPRGIDQVLLPFTIRNGILLTQFGSFVETRAPLSRGWF